MSYAESQYAWHNGRIVPWAEATVHVSAPSVQYGAGVQKEEVESYFPDTFECQRERDFVEACAEALTNVLIKGIPRVS